MTENNQYRYFNPQGYLDWYFSSDEADWEDRKIELDELHNIFASGDVCGKLLLDLGTGPSIHSVLSACRHFDEIYLTDYAVQNIEFLMTWLEGDKICIPHVIKYVLDKEGKGESVDSRNRYIKSKIKGIIQADITTCPVFESSDVPVLFDAITSTGCLDAAAHSKEQYAECVRNIRTLLLDGGVLVLIGEESESYYKFNDRTFTCFAIKGREVKEIFEDNGFKIIYWREREYPIKSMERLESDSKGHMVMVAKKM